MKIKMQKEEEEGLVSELDEIGGAFEEVCSPHIPKVNLPWWLDAQLTEPLAQMQEQNARLLGQLKEKDDENFRLMSTRCDAIANASAPPFSLERHSRVLKAHPLPAHRLKEQSRQAVTDDVDRARQAEHAALAKKLAAQSALL
jgi:hypothetical protein